jgi:WD40 repeat protein
MPMIAHSSSKIAVGNWSRYLWWPGWSSDGTRFTGASDDRPEVVRVLTADGTPGALFTGHTAGVNAARWSPAEDLVATASWDGTLRLWSATGQLLRTIHLAEEGSVEGVGWSSDGERLAAACSDGSVYALSPATGGIHQKWRFDGEVLCPAWSPDGTTLALTMENGWAFIDTHSGEILGHVHEKPGIEVVWRPDGMGVAVTCDDGNVWLDAGDANPQLLHSLDVPTLGASWHASGLLAVGDDAGGVHVLDQEGHELWHTQLEAEVIAVKWRPRSRELLAATRAHGAYLLAFEGMPDAQIQTERST